MRTENQTEETMVQRLGETYQGVLNVLKCALWNTGKASVDREVFRELKHHAVSTLPAGVLSSLTMPEKMRAMWQREIYQQISYNVNYRHEQAALPVSVPYVILKGTSAAKYYPHPEYRSMGDIDIMPRRKDYTAACEELLQNGYLESTGEVARDFGRHRQFRKNGIEIEVHSFFAIQNNQEQAALLDQLILDHISSSHELPDDINGLVLLDHISYHMEEGLGRKESLGKLKAEHEAAQKRNQLFDELGVTREGKGIVRYQDGKYVK